MTGFKGKFYVHKWKFYLVDMRDWHNPVLVRKHFDNKNQANDFKIKYGNRNYEIILGKIALNMELRDWYNDKPNHRHPIARFSKYNFPPHVKTQMQKLIFRGNKRRKLKRKKYRPMLTYKLFRELVDQNEMLFFKRLRDYTVYYTAYSNPVKGFNSFKKEYQYPFDIVNLSAIYRCLTRYYDLGVHDPTELSIFIYEMFRERVIKWRCGPDMSFKEEEIVKTEFLARGFIPKTDSKFEDNENAFVQTIYIKPILVYPEEAWIKGEDEVLYDHNVYELQGLVGIQGYTKACVMI